MKKITDFVSLYKLYRKHHKPVYALRRAYEISFKSYPF